MSAVVIGVLAVCGFVYSVRLCASFIDDSSCISTVHASRGKRYVRNVVVLVSCSLVVASVCLHLEFDRHSVPWYGCCLCIMLMMLLDAIYDHDTCRPGTSCTGSLCDVLSSVVVTHQAGYYLTLWCYVVSV